MLRAVPKLNTTLYSFSPEVFEYADSDWKVDKDRFGNRDTDILHQHFASSECYRYSSLIY